MGGEKEAVDWDAAVQQGSPPHGRGKDVKGNSWDKLPGITPAWAGKRPTAAAVRAELQDHPRMGGEK